VDAAANFEAGDDDVVGGSNDEEGEGWLRQTKYEVRGR
jgi:hypothetical protein